MFVIGITIVIIEATCATTPNTKRRKGAFPWPNNENILEIAKIQRLPHECFKSLCNPS